MKILLLVASLIVNAYGNELIPPGTEITQCDPEVIECPEISNTQVESGYELRTYPPSKWVSHMYTGASLDDFEESTSINFNILFDYISGENEEGMTIDMTAPVITHIAPGPGPNCETEFTMSFYVPKELQDDTPEPTGDGVFLEDLAEMSIYVIAFDGYADVNDYIDYALQLQENVGDDSLYYTDFYYFVGYNSPFDLFDRRNEVWFVAKN